MRALMNGFISDSSEMREVSGKVIIGIKVITIELDKEITLNPNEVLSMVVRPNEQEIR